MADITKELQAIENAVYGEEVRGSIHDAIDKINTVVESSATDSTNARQIADQANTTANNAKAIAEISFGNAVTSVTSPITGFVKGEPYFNTDTNDFWQCNGVGWTLIGNLKGVKGEKGDASPKPTGVVLVSQVGLIKTYNIVFSDNTTFPFQVSDGASGTGTGDMLKAVYDRDNSGVVDAAETIVDKTSHKIGATEVLVELSEDTDGDLNYKGSKIKGEGGTGGAILRISTTEPDFTNKPVRATLQSGSTTSAYFVNGTFDSTGKCELVVDEVGSYKITVTADKEYSINKEIPYYGVYSGIMLEKFKATIPVSVNGGVQVGEGAIVTATDGATTYTATTGIDGKANIQVGKSGVYTISATKGTVKTASTSTCTITTDGQTSALVVLYFASITLNYECDSAITYEVKKDTFSHTGADNASGSDTFLVPGTGTYNVIATIDTKEVTDTVTVSQYANVQVSIAAGSGFSDWVHTRFPSSEATSIEDLTEKQIRELMTVHDSVDTLADWLSSDSDSAEEILDYDLCAKWINLRDYALDKLYSVESIKSVMDTVDKYGYGEWVKIDDVWQPKGLVPVMTSNSAPYGECGGDYTSTRLPYHAFNGRNTSDDEYWSGGKQNARIYYKFVNPTKVNKVFLANRLSADREVLTFKIQASNTGSSDDWHDLGTFTNTNIGAGKTSEYTIENDNYYLYYALYTLTNADPTNPCIGQLQFYGRQLSVSVPKMEDNTTPWGACNAGENISNAYKVFDGSTSTYWNIGSGTVATVSNSWLAYNFNKPTTLKFVKIMADYTASNVYDRVQNFRVEGLNGDNNWQPIYTGIYQKATSLSSALQSFQIDNLEYFTQYRLLILDSYSSANGQVGVTELQFYGLDYSEREFAQGSTMKYIYDHGVELESIEEYKSTTNGNITKGGSSIIVEKGTGACVIFVEHKEDLTSYKLERVTVGSLCYGTSNSSPQIAIGSSNSSPNNKAHIDIYNSNDLPHNCYLNINSFNEELYATLGINTSTNDTGKVEFTEWWLE